VRSPWGLEAADGAEDGLVLLQGLADAPGALCGGVPGGSLGRSTVPAACAASRRGC
jgi:hypothetical protein